MSSILGGGGSGSGLIPLTANTNFYYSTTGNDSNPGTLAQPFKTIQGGLNNIAANYDINGFLVTLGSVPGTNADFVGFTFPTFVSTSIQQANPWGVGVIRVIGDDTDATKVTINSALNASAIPVLISNLRNQPVLCVVDCMTVDGSATAANIKLFASTAPGGNGLVAGNFDFTGTLTSSGLIVKHGFTAASAIGFDATQQGHLDVSGDVTVEGDFGEVLHAEQNALLTTGVLNTTRITVNNGTRFAAFASAGDDNDVGSGVIQFQETTFVDNGALGKKFEVQGPGAQISLVQLFGAGINALPGSSSGTCQWGGSFIYYDNNNNLQILSGSFEGAPSTQLTYTVAQLPVLNTTGNFTAVVTDASSPVIGNIVTGGGNTTAQVWWDGSSWRVTNFNSSSATLILDSIATQVASGTPTSGTTVNAPAGSLIVVFVGNANAAPATVTGLTDSAGNTYTQAAQTSGINSSYFNSSLWYCSNTAHDLPAGGTFTATTSSGKYGVAAAVAAAINGLDQTNTNGAGTGTGVSVATGTLGQAHEIIFGISYPSSSVGGFTESSGFTSMIPGEASAGNGDFAWQVVNSTSAVTYDPTWTINADSTAVIASFKF